MPAKVLKSCNFLSQLAIVLSIFLTVVTDCQSQVLRAPANYVPNDDVIIVPLELQIGFYEKHVKNDKDENVSRIRQQVKIWQENRLMAEQYGLDSASIGSPFYVPPSDEQWQHISRSYFRYLRRKGEDPLKRDSQDFMRSWNSSNEIDTIDEMEAHFRKTTTKSRLGKNLPSALQEREVAKTDRLRFHFQPRLEQGLFIFRVRSSVFDGRAWVGINGEAELNIQRTFVATGSRVMVNYFAHTGERLSAFDQDLGKGLTARYTQSVNSSDINYKTDNRLQLNFNAEF